MNESSHYERNLPHQLPPGATLFITYRLAGTLPREVASRLSEEAQLEPNGKPRKRGFVDYDTLLDHDHSASHWLVESAVAAVVKRSLHFYAPTEYALNAYCVMGNHVHLVVTLPEILRQPFVRVLQAQKRYSATQANRLLGQEGQFWARESYGHVIRNGAEYDRVVAYVLNNPVKAGLVTDWRDWPHSYWDAAKL